MSSLHFPFLGMYKNTEAYVRKIYRAVPEFIDPVFAKTSPKRSFSMTKNERFGLVLTKTGSINSGTGGVGFKWGQCILFSVVFTPPLPSHRLCLTPTRAQICKRVRIPEIDYKESIPPGWESFPGLLKRFTNTGSDISLLYGRRGGGRFCN
jgi:hypothetical protein